MKASTKLLSGILTLALVISMLFGLDMPNVKAKESGKCGDNLTWEMDEDGTLYINGTGDMYDYGNPKFDGWPYGFTTVVIGDGVTSIGESVFWDCLWAFDLIIGNSVTRIGDFAFQECGLSGSVLIPPSVKHIGYGAFQINSLEHVTFLGNVEEIGFEAFGSNDLKTATFFGDVKSIPEDEYDSFGTDSTVIYGYTGTNIQSYAKEHGISFVSLNDFYRMVMIGDMSSTTPTLVNTAKGIKITFDKVQYATHYEIRRKLKVSDKGDDVESTFSLVTTIPDFINKSSKISYYDTETADGNNGNTYVYYVRPIEIYEGNILNVGSTKNAQIRRVSTPTIKSCKNTAAGTVTIKWTKNSLATGYDVWYSDGRTSKSIRIKNKATLSQTVKGLTKGKTYTFKVRSIYITASGTIYKSAWKPAKVKIVK